MSKVAGNSTAAGPTWQWTTSTTTPIQAVGNPLSVAADVAILTETVERLVERIDRLERKLDEVLKEQGRYLFDDPEPVH